LWSIAPPSRRLGAVAGASLTDEDTPDQGHREGEEVSAARLFQTSLPDESHDRWLSHDPDFRLLATPLECRRGAEYFVTEFTLPL
jgi:hypothetical protein